MRPSGLRIAFTTLAWHDQGGIERCVMAEAGHLARRGHQVHVFAASFKAPLPPGVVGHRVPVPARPWVVRICAFALRSPGMVRKAGPFDIVHAHTAYLGRGHVAHAHSVHRRAMDFDKPTGAWMGIKWWLKSLPPLMRAVSDLTFRRAGHCVAISRRIERELVDEYAIEPQRRTLLYNGVQVERFKPLAAKPRQALRRRLGMAKGAWAVFCGWNWRRKGLDVALEALEGTRGVSLAVVGEDPLEGAAFRAEVQRRGLGARVLFAGRQADPVPWFQAADFFAFPTRYEPFGMVVSEAMACGLPVLVPQEAGASEVLRDERRLQVLPFAEDAAALAKGMRALGSSPAKAKALGRANRKAALGLSWGRHGRALEKLYRALAAR